MDSIESKFSNIKHAFCSLVYCIRARESERMSESINSYGKSSHTSMILYLFRAGSYIQYVLRCTKYTTHTIYEFSMKLCIIGLCGR